MTLRNYGVLLQSENRFCIQNSGLYKSGQYEYLLPDTYSQKPLLPPPSACPKTAIWLLCISIQQKQMKNQLKMNFCTKEMDVCANTICVKMIK